QPTRGVRASITPKIRPVLRASEKRGLCSAAPLHTAAANASVDMASASISVDKKVMYRFPAGRRIGYPYAARRRVQVSMVSPCLAAGCAMADKPSMLTQPFHAWTEADYSPKRRPD